MARQFRPLPHEKWGEVGRAFIVLKPGARLDEAAIIDHCRSKLARYKVPRDIRFVDALPHNATGKIAERELPRELMAQEGVGLNGIMNPGPAPLRLDFAGGAVGYRFRRGSGRDHPLVRAAGFRKERIPTVVDATAGLGRDAFLLASVGARIVLLERSAEVHTLLKDALARASAASPDLAEVVARMTLIHGDARDHLPGLRPDVVMVDPMHPPRQNSALVKQEMRLLSGIVGPDEDAHDLMQVALASARERVVLKWPLRAKPLLESPKPSHQFSGKTVRYEVFMTGTKTSVK